MSILSFHSLIYLEINYSSFIISPIIIISTFLSFYIVLIFSLFISLYFYSLCYIFLFFLSFIYFLKYITSMILYRIYYQKVMGCFSSTEKVLSELTLSQTDPNEFKLSYRQFVKNDIGQVFQFYHFSKIINRSSTSLIRKVIHRTSKIERICKIVPVQKKYKIHAIKEVENLKNLDHPNIVQVQQYFFDKTYLYIIMESIHGNKLSQFLLNHSTCSLDSLLKIFQQLLSAVNYCHKKSLVHNLIYPQNILVIQRGKQYFVKLIDFSQASVNKSPKISKIQFPKQYKYFKDPNSNNQTNALNDVWSCGMTFLFLLSGQKSFEDFENRKQSILRQTIDAFDIQSSTAAKLLDFLSKMLTSSHSQRPSIQECLAHDIFKEFKQQRPSSKHRKKEDSFLSRLVHFKVQNTLQSVFWMYASLNLLSSTQKCEYMTQFCNLDKNKDGKLDRYQIKQGLLNTFGFSNKEADTYVQNIFNSIDKNNNEYLEYSQFVMATSLISKHISDEQLQKIFKQIDYNQDGLITPQELSCIVGGLEGAGSLLKQKKKLSMKQFKNLMYEIFQLSQQKPIEQK